MPRKWHISLTCQKTGVINLWRGTTCRRAAESEGFRFGFSGVGEIRAKRAFRFDSHVPLVPPIPIVPALSLVVPEKWSLFGHKMSSCPHCLSEDNGNALLGQLVIAGIIEYAELVSCIDALPDTQLRH